MTTSDSGNGAWTYDLPDMSRMLYQLSYAAVMSGILHESKKNVKALRRKKQGFSIKSLERDFAWRKSVTRVCILDKFTN